MGMNVGSGGGGNDPDVMMEINATPLIDVMLVLLIMLIITIPIQTHAVKLNMPSNTAAAPPTPPIIVSIYVDFDGTLVWNDVVVSAAELESKFRDIARLDDQPEVHLRPNKLATYKYVAQVMASAQRLGVTKIGLVGNEQFVN